MHDSGGHTSSSDTSSHHSSSSSHSSDTSWNSSHTPHMSPSSPGMPLDQNYYPTLNPTSFGNTGFSSSGGPSVGLMIAIGMSILVPIVIALVAFLSVG